MHDAIPHVSLVPGENDFLALSGGRVRLGPREQYEWTRILRTLEGWRGFITGGCVGFDDFAGRTLVKLFPTHEHVIYVPANRTLVAAWWRGPEYRPFTQVREMNPGTTYRDRDQAMIDHGAALLAKPSHPEDDPRSRRSGTWLTVRLARAAGKPVCVLA